MKFRITQTTTVEFEVNPDNYEGETDPLKMLQIDLDNVKGDETVIFCLVDEPEIKVEGSVIP